MSNLAKWAVAVAVSVGFIWFVRTNMVGPEKAIEIARERKAAAAAAVQRQKDTRVCAASVDGVDVRPGQWVEVALQRDCWTGTIRFNPVGAARWHWAFTCAYCRVHFAGGKIDEYIQPNLGSTKYWQDAVSEPPFINAHGHLTIIVGMWMEGQRMPQAPKVRMPGLW